LDPEYIQSLAPNILGAHVDDAFHTKPSTDGCCRNTMLAGTSFCDDALLAYPSGQ
jgi:hypothetical protein